MRPGAALVTGGAKRIGRALALDLAAAGWAVAVHYNTSREAADATVAEVRATGAAAAAVGADLLDHAAVDALVGRAAEALGRPLTLLVNNASIFEHDTLATATRAGWDRHVDSNLWAPVALTRDFAAQAPEPEIDALGRPVAAACVVNMIDQRVWKPTPEFMTYGVAKAGLWAFTRMAAQALAPKVRVNGIGPGPSLQGPRQTPEHFARQQSAVPLQRGADPSELAAALRFILSAGAMTGQMIALDGGQHLAWRTPDVLGVE
ncbi:MAG: SDR family oxidoreductase [Rhodobacteraceae bacterium]|nr:MAG: SDR family oxidoreductase [Paracoccaceae bacterium]